MHKLIEIWNKNPLQLSTEELTEAAEVLYHIMAQNALSGGEKWSMNPEFVCELNQFLPVPVTVKEEEKNMSYQDFLSRAFKEKTGEEWDSEKYVLVHVPLKLVGGARYVIFKK